MSRNFPVGCQGLMRVLGVVPVYKSLGDPIPSRYNKVEEVPDYIDEYVRDTNKVEKEYAIRVGSMEKPKKK